MRKLISFILLFPIFSFSQPIIDIGYDNNDSIKKVTIVPFFSTHFSLNQSREFAFDQDIKANTFLAYGTNIDAQLSSKLQLSAKILKLQGEFNTALSDYIDSLGVLPGMNKI